MNFAREKFVSVEYIRSRVTHAEKLSPWNRLLFAQYLFSRLHDAAAGERPIHDRAWSTDQRGGVLTKSPPFDIFHFYSKSYSEWKESKKVIFDTVNQSVDGSLLKCFSELLASTTNADPKVIR